MEIPLFNETGIDAPCCSRCGMAYGEWELTLKWEGDKPIAKAFEHLPGCKWYVPGNRTKDFGEMLRQTEIIPRNANIVRLH